VAAGPVPEARGRPPGLAQRARVFDANETGGTARLALDGGAIELPACSTSP
jgi:hypothetical protein